MHTVGDIFLYSVYVHFQENKSSLATTNRHATPKSLFGLSLFDCPRVLCSNKTGISQVKAVMSLKSHGGYLGKSGISAFSVASMYGILWYLKKCVWFFCFVFHPLAL